MKKKQITPEQASKIVWKVVAIFVVLNMCIMGWFFLSKMPTPLSKVFNYVPSSADQVFVVHPNNDAQELLTSNGIQQFNGEIETILKDTDTIIIAQENSLENASNTIFIQSDNLDKQKFLELINQGGDTKYIYESLEENISVFGEPRSLEKINNEDGFFDDVKLNEFKKIFAKYTISLISKPVNNDLVTNTTLNQTINNSQYFIAGANVLKDKINIETHIVYKENQEIIQDYKFKSKFSKYADNNNVLFLELGNIAKQTGITEKVLEENIKLISSIYGMKFDKNDYKALFDSIDGNIGILVNKSNNIFNLGIGLLFDNDQIRNTIKNNIYEIKYLLELNPTLTNSLSGKQELELIDNDNQIGFIKNLAGIPPVKLIAQKEDNQTIISLGEPILEGNNEDSIKVKDNTIATFQLDLDQAISLYTNFAALFMGQTSIDTTQFEVIKDKKLQGQIMSYPNKVSILSTIK